MTGSLTIFVAALVTAVPIAIALLGAALIYYMTGPQPTYLVIQRMVSGVAAFPLLAVPFFVLAGTAMARGGIARRLLDFADGMVGHMKGGLGQVNVFNSLLMGGMSGSANADAAIDARVLVPVMVKKGYGRDFSSALSAASGVIAPIIPPGIGLIIYGLLAQVSVGQLFVAGVVPGLALALALMFVVRIVAGGRGYGQQRVQRVKGRELVKLTRDAFWALMMPILLIVGLRVGVFTPTELGAMAAAYAFVVGVVVYREIPLREVMSVLREAALTTSVVMLIVACAAALSAVITLERLPQQMIEGLLSLSGEPFVILLAINLGLLVLGSLMEGTALLVMLAPILAPLAVSLGVDPVQFGVVVVLNLTIGGITPPVGTVMYTVCSITGSTVEGFSREILAFLLATVVVLLLITFVPAISLALPNLLFGN